MAGENSQESQSKPLDAIDRGAYDEWRDHPATKCLITACREDIAMLRGLILGEAKKAFPEFETLASFGAQLYARETLLSYATERSDDPS